MGRPAICPWRSAARAREHAALRVGDAVVEFAWGVAAVLLEGGRGWRPAALCERWSVRRVWAWMVVEAVRADQGEVAARLVSGTVLAYLAIGAGLEEPITDGRGERTEGEVWHDRVIEWSGRRALIGDPWRLGLPP